MSGQRGSNSDPVFHRDPGRRYVTAARAEGAYIHDRAGKRYLDAAGSTFVINLGHGPHDVIEAMTKQATQAAFAYTGSFTTDAEVEFCRRLLALAPAGFSKAWVCTSGSQANETAIKLARSYHLLSGEGARVQVASRWNSYHGSSLGALALTGHAPRREQYVPYLLPSPKVEPPYCYRCPFGKTYPECALACADDLEDAVRRIGPANMSAFIVEPVSGGPLGALVPPAGYLKRIREICDCHGILMIADEVVTGAGRTGKPLGIDHFDVVPDIITMAKGIGGGLVPVGAVLVHDRIVRRFEEKRAAFRHGETFTGHAVVAATGAAVLAKLERDRLIERSAAIGGELQSRLRPLADLDRVGDIRGIGLLWGIEIVADKATRRPYPRSARMAERIADHAFESGLIVVPGSGCADGVDGDTLCLSPPFIITTDDCDFIAETLREAILSETASAG